LYYIWYFLLKFFLDNLWPLSQIWYLEKRSELKVSNLFSRNFYSYNVKLRLLFYNEHLYISEDTFLRNYGNDLVSVISVIALSCIFIWEFQSRFVCYNMLFVCTRMLRYSACIYLNNSACCLCHSFDLRQLRSLLLSSC